MTKSAAPGLQDAARILQAAGGPLLSQAKLHAKLAGIEWQEEKNRLLRMLAAALLGFACLLCALLFAGALALAMTWDTPYRVPTIAALVILSSLGLVAAWRYFKAQSALESFAASREELAADSALLKAAS